MRTTLSLVTLLGSFLGALAAPPTSVNLTMSDVVRAAGHLDMAEDTVTEWSGDMFAYAPGALPARLFRVSGVTTARAIPNTLNGYTILSRELLLYYNENGTLAETFTSPWDQQTYQVIHTQNNPVYSLVDNKTYTGSSDGVSTTLTVATRNSFMNPLNSSDATREILSTYSGNLTNITTLDTTTYVFPTAQLPLTAKPQSLSNVTISRTRVSPLLPFMNASVSVASTTTLFLVLHGRKVSEGIDGLSASLQTQLEEKKLWAYEDAPISRDDAGSGPQKATMYGTNDWVEFSTTNVFNPWRMNTTGAFPMKDVGDWCDA
ncbi:hypothetical protein BN14_11545 [Rhizoctonia solani AG-1 IB]|uniref:Uncharacterized protein n=1 Tax=Thanatephorus cucumeris (strain AG1-IB / isolate 7/3/14) TaxID=1108050 RepID=M5CDP8_THACB|nr:hypothetical protein BN14_11545 [Rhizoctonia solani AG-1 IB]